MKRILVLGAGHSAPYLIHHLLEQASVYGAEVLVADAQADAAAAAVAGHERGRALGLDVADEDALRREIAQADIAVHLLPPRFQGLIAQECLRGQTHMVSASYISRQVRELSADAASRGLRWLCEMGLDPGMDLMSAKATIARVQAEGGIVEGCQSYGGGVPALDAEHNPWRYVVTWNPRNVVMAANHGAQFLKDGQIRLVPWQRVFKTTWSVDIPGQATFEAYANRDSLSYRELLGLEQASVLIRGTLRYPGWGELWHQMVELGLPNEELELPDPASHTYRDLVRMFLPEGSGDVRDRVAEFLNLDPSGEIMGKLDWLGLFSDQPLQAHHRTPALALADLMKARLVLEPDARDAVILHHIFDVRYPASGERQRVRSTFVAHGDPGGFTAMAKSVGLTAALGVEMILRDQVPTAGASIPTEPELYEPLLDELARHGMGFQEDVQTLGTPVRP